MRIAIPTPALVMMVGPAGSGKSTFTARNFAPEEILGADRMREKISGDINEQSVTSAAYEAVYRGAEARLAEGRVAVIDASCAARGTRDRLFAVAARHGAPVIGIQLAIDPATCQKNMRRRVREGSKQNVPDFVPVSQAASIAGARLEDEPFTALHRLTSMAEIGAATVQRLPPGRQLPATLATDHSDARASAGKTPKDAGIRQAARAYAERKLRQQANDRAPIREGRAAAETGR